MAQILTGAKARVIIDGKPVGFIGGLNVNQENTLTDVDILGELEVGDLAETGHKINFSINYFKAVEAAEGPAADGRGNVIETAAILGLDSGRNGLKSMKSQAYFDVIVIDDTKSIDNEVYKMSGCKFEGGSGQVDARGVWNGTWNFRAKTGFGL